MPRLINRNPKYRKHRASGQAVVTIEGHDFYLGPHGTKASKDEYDRIVSEWLACGRRLPQPAAQVTVAELLATYLRHAKTFYRNPDGTVGPELERVNLSIPLLAKMYALTPVSEFGAVMLKTIRLKMVEKLSRKTINDRINCIRRVFRWGVSEDIVPVDVLQKLESVEGLRCGRTDAREGDPVKPIAESVILATIAHASPQIAAMAKLQLLTGMRPGEVCRMRTCDIDTTGRIWLYKPAMHKTAWHGHERTVYIGPRAQVVLKPFLKLDTQAHIFTPAESEAWRLEQRRMRRKTPMSCGNRPGTNRKRRPEKRPGSCYDSRSYRQAIEYACDAAFLAPEGVTGDELKRWRADHRWNPHRIRHTAATMLRKEHGLEAAQVILGHKTLTVTQVYAEKNVEAAMKIMAEVG